MVAELRLASTCSLWDGIYVDESWIGQAVYLIPRMKQLIAENYPGQSRFLRLQALHPAGHHAEQGPAERRGR